MATLSVGYIYAPYIPLYTTPLYAPSKIEWWLATPRWAVYKKHEWWLVTNVWNEISFINALRLEAHYLLGKEADPSPLELLLPTDNITKSQLERFFTTLNANYHPNSETCVLSDEEMHVMMLQLWEEAHEADSL